MQYVWQFRLWPATDMRTTDGLPIQVLQPGVHNKDAGPDFFNAQLMIDGQLWSGNVEIHVRASDWHRHHHDGDPAYDSVVLHVVEVSDTLIHRSNGQVIPQMVMQCTPDFADKYNDLVNNPLRELSCSHLIPTLPSIYITDWLAALAYERLYDKADRIFRLLQNFAGDWSQAIYVTLARAMGFGTNADPFEMLALTTPLKYMQQHSDSLLSIEAILFGQAGMLDGVPVDEYQRRITDEYRFMCAKFGLKRSTNLLWKMSRMRPQNFPHRRIAALARFITGNFPFSSQILEIKTEEEARRLFDVTLEDYWSKHFTFSTIESVANSKALSRASVTILLINVVVPVIFAYAYSVGDRQRLEFAVDLLHSLEAERNTIVETFGRGGIVARNAFESQALLHLRRQYCQPRKCLYCRIGHALLSRKVKR